MQVATALPDDPPSEPEPASTGPARSPQAPLPGRATESESLIDRAALFVADRPSWGIAVLVGLLAGVAALGLTAVLDATVGEPTVTFVIPLIALATWLGGTRGGLVALATALVLIATLEFERRYRPWTIQSPDIARLGGIAAASMMLIFLYEVTRAAATRSRRALVRQQELTAAVSASEGRWRALSSTAPALITQSGIDGVMTFANPAFEEYTGGIPAEREERYRRLVHPDDRAHLGRLLTNLEEAAATTYDVRLRRADGEYRWHVGTTAPVHDSDGEAMSFVSVYVDVHDQKVAEQALGVAQQRWRSLADATPALIFESHRDGSFLYQNATAERYFGVDLHSLTREERMQRMAHPEDRDTLVSAIERLSKGEASVAFEYRARRHDGEYRWHMGVARPMPDDADRWIITAVDIHERRAAKQAILDKEAEFRALVESSPAFVFRGDRRGALMYASPGFYDYIGSGAVTGAEARSVERVIHPDDLQSFIDVYTKAWSSGSPVDIEYRLRRNDGQYRWFLAQTVPMRDPGGAITGWVGTAVDIHDRKMAEDELEYRERELQLVVDTARVHTFRAGPKGRIRHVSSSFLEYSGLAYDELIGDDWAKTGIIHPDDFEQVRAATRAAVEKGEPYQLEYRIRGADGVYRWHLTRATPERDRAGKVTGWQGVSLEVEQLHQTRADLERALAAKDEFLGMVSHELRTPITTIAGNAHVLARKYAVVDEETRNRALTDINEEATRLSRLVDNLLALARLERGEAPEIEPVLLRRLVEQICAAEDRAGVREYEIHVPDIIVLANQLYLEQVLRNLISNARKYSPAIEPVTVSAREVDGFAEITVADHGIGLDEAEAERLFTPFYRSERTAHTQGVGIGLAVCKRLIESLGGEIVAGPRADGAAGAEFRFTLPLHVE